MIRLLTNLPLRSKINIRYFPLNKMSDKPENVNIKESAASQSLPPDGRLHIVTNLERSVLVWVGMYKSKEQVPNKISVGAYEKARNKARIKMSNYLIVIIGIACFCIALSGRRSAEKGDTVARRNIDWHKQVIDEEKK